MPLSWSFVAFMRAWSGYHFSLADRVGVVPLVGVVVEGGVVVVGAVGLRGADSTR
jgi:Cu/Ag efflux pump CusA